MMDELFSILVRLPILGALLVVPFLLGRSIESARRGLVLLSILPVLVALLGFLLYLAASSAEEDPREMFGPWIFLGLSILAGAAEVAGIAAWAVGRWSRSWDRGHDAKPPSWSPNHEAVRPAWMDDETDRPARDGAPHQERAHQPR
jgi:hypothetical protein